MHGIPTNLPSMITGYLQQKMMEETCELQTCPRCKREVYWVEADTGLCMICASLEEEC